MQRRIIIASAQVEKLKQEARKLKRTTGVPHHEALDRAAQSAGFNHWHHVTESAKAFEPTESAYRFGVIIAMDIKDAQDFYDETGAFVVDDLAFVLCEDDLYHHLYESLDEEDGIRIRDKYSAEELKEWARDDLMNYTFFRFTGKPIPDRVESIVEMVRECTFWPPIYIWHKGQFQECPSDVALDSYGQIVGVKF
jgi:hypothetical protein